MPLHDPFVVADDSTRTYHLYTSNEPSVSGVDGTGTMVYRSRDLRDWTRPVVVFLASEQRELWASDGGWVPEVHERDGRYYLFTTLHNEDRPLPVPPANQWGTPFQVANYMRGTNTAVSDSLLGPFTVVQSVRDHDPHAPLPRSAFLVVYDRADTATYEARVDLTTGTLTSWTHLPGIQPAIMIEEIMALDDIVKKDPRAVAALERHGVHDLDLLQIDPWSTGTLPIDGIDARRRIIRASAYVRTFPEDNGYARPVGNLVFVIDCNEQSVAAIIEGDPIPVPPPESGNYDVDSVGPLRTDLRPLEITQPDGPSFTLDGHVIEWQRWRLHAHIDTVEGLVISDVSYLDGDRRRSVLHRASISEMVVPCGDTSDDFYFRNVFDAGEYNLGKTVGSLSLGCDCLGEIRYLDAVPADESGVPHTVTNAICLHVEDYGILWKHWNFRYTDQAEVRRSRRFVVSAIHTIGNYEYGFFWYFYLDGTIQFEAKLTGIVQTRAIAPGATPQFRSPCGPATGRTQPPAPVQHAAGPGSRRPRQHRRGSRRGGHADRTGQSLRQRHRGAQDPDRQRTGQPPDVRPAHRTHLEDHQPRRAQPPRRTGRLQARTLRRPDLAGGPGQRSRPASGVRPHTAPRPGHGGRSATGPNG